MIFISCWYKNELEFGFTLLHVNLNVHVLSDLLPLGVNYNCQAWCHLSACVKFIMPC